MLVRFPHVAAVAVYGVPDPRSGDQVMAALELLPGAEFDPGAFGAFLAEQGDLGTKWVPSFLRVTEALPQTANGKVTKSSLRREGWWRADDTVYRLRPARPGSTPVYELLGHSAVTELRDGFAAHGRLGLLDR